jgi:serine/threonine protein kinase
MSEVANAPPSLPTLDDPRVLAALEEYLAEVEAGRVPDRPLFLDRHAPIAAPLALCLDGMDVLRSLEPGPLDSSDAASEPGPLGDFRILHKIGRGGMGLVYEAEQISLGRHVALKVLPFAATMDPRHLQRFKNEARSAASLEHPHIVPVYGVGCERGVHYYAMKFINGQSLAEVIAAQAPASRVGQRPEADARTVAYGAAPPPSLSPSPLVGEGGSEANCHPPTPTLPHKGGREELPPAETQAIAAAPTQATPRDKAAFRCIAEWGAQAAEALEYAHGMGIVHRDVKPGNLMIDGQNKLWITDFGLARTGADGALTMPGDVLGTLRYMSPEQALAKHDLVDHRTDIYSLGVTLYELLTLEPPFAGKDREELLRQIAFEEPRALGRLNKAIPAELATIVMKAMEKDPEDRYTTAGELADDLRRFLRDEPIRARPLGVVRRLGRWCRRRRAVVTTAAVGVVLVLLTAVASLAVGLAQVREQQQETQTQATLAQRAATAEKAARKRAQDNEHKATAAATAAMQAAADEKKAWQAEAAQRRQAEAVASVLESVFNGLDPRAQTKGGPDFKQQLTARLDEATGRVAAELAGEPLVRARL